MGSLAEFRNSKKGHLVSAILSDPGIVSRMEDYSRAGRSAVRAIDDKLPPSINLSNPERQHIGRWIKQVMVERGWQLTSRRDDAGGWRILSSGAVYSRPSPAPEPVEPAKGNDFATRLTRARAVVKEASTNEYGVDDFIADKRKESAAEAARSL